MIYGRWYMIWYIVWYDIYDMIYDTIWYDMKNFLTASGLTPGGSSRVHIYTQTTIHRTTQLTITKQLRREQHK
jgi:hypothetical protein